MFLDIGVGVLLAIFSSEFFNLPLTGGFLTAGIIFSLLADIDYVFYLGDGGNSKEAHKHRDLLHYPLFYIPSGMILISFFSFPWAVLFGLCSFFHFLHDSIGIGWGIQWLYPFRKDHYAFFYRYQPPNRELLPKKMLYIWKHEDIAALAKRYGDEDWLKNIYGHWHPYAIAEFLIFIIAFVILYLYIW